MPNLEENRGLIKGQKKSLKEQKDKPPLGKLEIQTKPDR